MVSAFLTVEILHFPLFQVGLFEVVHRTVSSLELDSGDHVLEFASIKGLAFSGLCELKIHDDIGLFIDENLQALS
jgi:hypothetical protein